MRNPLLTTIFQFSAGLLLAVSSLGQNPVPFVHQPLSPMTVPPGSSGFTLTVQGAAFVPGAIVQWNGNSRSTTFVNRGKLTAQIPSSDLTSPATSTVTVLSPLPGGGRSNAVSFQITKPVVQVSFKTVTAAALAFRTAVVGDFNEDGKADVAGVLGSTVSILLGNGDGTFQTGASYTVSTGSFPTQIIVADFNADGHLDLAIADPTTHVVPILLGNGSGEFQPSLPIAASAWSLFAADFNRDGRLDLAVAGGASPGTVSIFPGNGDGTFQPPNTIPLGINANSVTGGDFDGDGNIDLAVSLGDGKPPLLRTFVAVLLGNGDGTFQSAPSLITQGISTQHVIAADLNNDGKLDLVTGTTFPGTGSGVVFLGKGDGTFQNFRRIGVCNSFPNFFDFGDFNGDGQLDLGVEGGLCMFLGKGTGNFKLAFGLGPTPQNFPLITGDFNGDGLLDTLVSSQFPTIVTTTFLQNSKLH